MKGKENVSFATKWVSNKHYLNEVPVEGKHSPRFFKLIWSFDTYHQQVIRAGNCLSLLNTTDSIAADSFWNLRHLEHNCRYLFFTFNNSFLLMLREKIHQLAPFQIERAIELLQEFPMAYASNLLIEEDEELQWCMIKLQSLKRDAKFKRMFSIDQSNRKQLLDALELKVKPLTTEHVLPTPVDLNEPIATFPEILNIPDGKNHEDIIKVIAVKIKEAEFNYDLFNQANKVQGGKNPYGLNAEIAAMIDFFTEKNYFKSSYTRKDIFKAYLQYTGNTIGKLDTYLSQSIKDQNYKLNFRKLKNLQISKLP